VASTIIMLLADYTVEAPLVIHAEH